MIELGYISGNLDEVVNTLLQYKAEGKQASCKFGGHTFYSDTISMDAAYIAVTGHTREDYYRQQEEARRYAKEARKRALETEEQREARYKRLVEATRVPGEEIEIEEDTVVEGLRFILKNPGLSHEKLVLGLLMLDCNFNQEDCNRQFDATQIMESVEEGLNAGNLSSAADVIIHVRDSEYGRAIFYERLQGLAKRYIGKVTGDDSYGNGDESYTGGGSIKK